VDIVPAAISVFPSTPITTCPGEESTKHEGCAITAGAANRYKTEPIPQASNLRISFSFRGQFPAPASASSKQLLKSPPRRSIVFARATTDTTRPAEEPSGNSCLHAVGISSPRVVPSDYRWPAKVRQVADFTGQSGSFPESDRLQVVVRHLEGYETFTTFGRSPLTQRIDGSMS